MAAEPTQTFYEAIGKPSVADNFVSRIPSFAGQGFFKGPTGLGAALGGFAGSSLVNSGLGEDANIGSSIGSALGGLLGSAGGFLGSFLGSGIGGSIGSNFGPAPTVGPNGQAWIGRGQDGLLGIMGASGDNGITGDAMRQMLQPSLNFANQFQIAGELPKHFQVRGGMNGMAPAIEIGGYMQPVLNDMSLARAMAKKGLLSGEGIGEDPQMVAAGGFGEWYKMDELSPYNRSIMGEVQDHQVGGPQGLGWYYLDPTRNQVPMHQTAEGYEYDIPNEQVADAFIRMGRGEDVTKMGRGQVPQQAYAGGGLIDGFDGGMDDTIETTIDGKQPAALSSGEFVMPADVVSALGDGNTKAGAKKLEGIISLIRQKKYGRDRQPPAVGDGILDLLKNGKM